jgi:peptidoglycan/LPS O-acetylase OafA/YrhL
MLRLAPLLAIGALAVHQLRYALGGTTSAAHGYLGAVGALVAGITVLAVAALVRRAVGGQATPAPRLWRLWAANVMALLAVFTAQELAEGASPVSRGGWLAAPLALVIAFVIALLMRGAGAARAAASRPWRSPGRARHAVALLFTFTRAGRPPLRLASARGPPAASA